MKYNQEKKFEDPFLTGSYAKFDINYLLDYLPPIDIIFKCTCIKGFNELKSINTDTMKNKLNLNYIEISSSYDKDNEIVKINNKCKIKIKNDKKNNNSPDNMFIYVNIIFVGINLSSFNQKEKNINTFFFSNSISDKKGKVLICLFFRRWRRKYKLFFIMPEFIDVIVNFYYNEQESLALIIQKILHNK